MFVQFVSRQAGMTSAIALIAAASAVSCTSHGWTMSALNPAMHHESPEGPAFQKLSASAANSCFPRSQNIPLRACHGRKFTERLSVLRFYHHHNTERQLYQQAGCAHHRCSKAWCVSTFMVAFIDITAWCNPSRSKLVENRGQNYWCSTRVHSG